MHATVKAVVGVAKGVNNTANTVGGVIVDTGKTVGNTVTSAVEGGAKTAVGVANGIAKTGNSISHGDIGGAVDNLGKTGSSFAKNVVGGLKKTGNTIADGATNLGKDAAKNLEKTGKDAIDDANDSTGALLGIPGKAAKGMNKENKKFNDDMKKAGDKISKDLGIGLAQTAPLVDGGVQPVFSPTILVDPICLNSDFIAGATPDAEDDENCEYFSVNPDECQYAAAYTTRDFDPLDMCCSCGGGFTLNLAISGL